MKKGKQDGEFETARAVESLATSQDNTITLSSGVVLRGKQANPLILVQVLSLPRPEPPEVYMEVMGRTVENPDDPAYIERLQNWKMEYADRVTNAMIVLGTEFVSAPKKLGHPDDNKWLEEYSLLGMPVHAENKTWRYLTWVKFKAVQNERDMALLQEVVGRLSGVSETAVKSAENFPGSDKADRGT